MNKQSEDRERSRDPIDDPSRSIIDGNNPNNRPPRRKRNRIDDDIEAAGEVAPPAYYPAGAKKRSKMQEAKATEQDMGVALGVTGLVFALFSFLVWQFFFAPVAIILGAFAIQKRARTLGWWTVGVGTFALIVAIFIVPIKTLF